MHPDGQPHRPKERQQLDARRNRVPVPGSACVPGRRDRSDVAKSRSYPARSSASRTVGSNRPVGVTPGTDRQGHDVIRLVRDDHRDSAGRVEAAQLARRAGTATSALRAPRAGSRRASGRSGGPPSTSTRARAPHRTRNGCRTTPGRPSRCISCRRSPAGAAGAAVRRWPAGSSPVARWPAAAAPVARATVPPAEGAATAPGDGVGGGAAPPALGAAAPAPAAAAVAVVPGAGSRPSPRWDRAVVGGGRVRCRRRARRRAGRARGRREHRARRHRRGRPRRRPGQRPRRRSPRPARSWRRRRRCRSGREPTRPGAGGSDGRSPASRRRRAARSRRLVVGHRSAGPRGRRARRILLALSAQRGGALQSGFALRDFPDGTDGPQPGPPPRGAGRLRPGDGRGGSSTRASWRTSGSSSHGAPVVIPMAYARVRRHGLRARVDARAGSCAR